MTERSEALVATDRPARYAKQLVSHLGRRNGGEWLDDEDRGFIVLGSGRAELRCVSDGLHLSVEGEPEYLSQLEDVVGRHLVRFGERDQLQVSWSRSDGQQGTDQKAASEG
jgi:hypothetical protein